MQGFKILHVQPCALSIGRGATMSREEIEAIRLKTLELKLDTFRQKKQEYSSLLDQVGKMVGMLERAIDETKDQIEKVKGQAA